MKHLNDKVIDYLKEERKLVDKYNQPFKEAREIAKKHESERLSQYEKFKKEQDKGKSAEDMLRGFLTKDKK